MLRLSTLAILLSAGAAALPSPAIAQTGVIDSVLLRWREPVEKCLRPVDLDSTAPLDLNKMVHVAMFGAVNAVSGKYQPYAVKLAAANDVIVKSCPKQKVAVDALLASALAQIVDSGARAGGVAVGQQAAAAIIAARAQSVTTSPDSFYPAATARVYVPTIRQVGTRWLRSKPWIMKTGSELRPPAPPSLTSETWGRDYEEIRRNGAK